MKMIYKLGAEREMEPTLEDWIEALKVAAEETPEEIAPDCRKDYFPKSRSEKIEKRNAMAEEGDRKKSVNKMSKEMKKLTRLDKKESLLEQFRENKNDWHKKHLWKAVKKHKGSSHPNSYK